MLGATVSTTRPEGTVTVELFEVEAYDGPNDPASHAYRGKTDRNAPMFGPSGTIYVYRSYGIHWCMNVVTGAEGEPSAILLRGGTVVQGHHLARERRGRDDHLADGPGKLCQALAVDGDASGTAINDGDVRIELPPVPIDAYAATPRIGISKATRRPWRFVAAG